MTAPDDEWFARAVGRIWKVMAALALAGTLGALCWRGWTWGAGFAAGAAISCLNFRWLKNLTDVLGGKPLRRGSALVLAFRYLLLGGGAYVILRYSPVSLAALLTGLFVSIAAVIIEVLFELLYARA
jgi:hypothetical protein